MTFNFYLDKTNKYDLEAIRLFLTSNVQIIRDNELENQYFTSEDEYGLKYISIDENLNDTKMIKNVSENKVLFLNTISGGMTLVCFGLGAYCGYKHGKQKKKSN